MGLRVGVFLFLLQSGIPELKVSVQGQLSSAMYVSMASMAPLLCMNKQIFATPFHSHSLNFKGRSHNT
jgi:hypothetical protein